MELIREIMNPVPVIFHFLLHIIRVEMLFSWPISKVETHPGLGSSSWSVFKLNIFCWYLHSFFPHRVILYLFSVLQNVASSPATQCSWFSSMLMCTYFTHSVVTCCHETIQGSWFGWGINNWFLPVSWWNFL